MRILTMIFGALLITLAATQVSASPIKSPMRMPAALETCKIVTGYGTAIGKGSTKKEALKQARLTCGTNMIDQYSAQRGRIPADVEDDLVLACVNLECQQ